MSTSNTHTTTLQMKEYIPQKIINPSKEWRYIPTIKKIALSIIISAIPFIAIISASILNKCYPLVLTSVLSAIGLSIGLHPYIWNIGITICVLTSIVIFVIQIKPTYENYLVIKALYKNYHRKLSSLPQKIYRKKRLRIIANHIFTTLPKVSNLLKLDKYFSNVNSSINDILLDHYCSRYLIFNKKNNTNIQHFIEDIIKKIKKKGISPSLDVIKELGSFSFNDLPFLLNNSKLYLNGPFIKINKQLMNLLKNKEDKQVFLLHLNNYQQQKGYIIPLVYSESEEISSLQRLSYKKNTDKIEGMINGKRDISALIVHYIETTKIENNKRNKKLKNLKETGIPEVWINKATEILK